MPRMPPRPSNILKKTAKSGVHSAVEGSKLVEDPVYRTQSLTGSSAEPGQILGNSSGIPANSGPANN